MTKQEIFALLDEYQKLNRQYYTIAETAKILKVSRGTIYNMMKNEELIGVKINNQTRFTGLELDKFQYLAGASRSGAAG